MNGKKAKALRKLVNMVRDSGAEQYNADKAYKHVKRLYKDGKIK